MASAPPRLGVRLSDRARPIALLVCERAAPSAELLRIAAALRTDGRVEPVVVAGCDVAVDELLAEAPEVRVVRSGAVGSTPSSPGDRRRGVASLRVGRTTAEALVTAVRLVRARRRAASTIRRVAPSVVVATDDRSLGPERAHLLAARGRSRRVLVPFALSDPGSDAYLRRDRRDLRVSRPGHLVQRAIARLLPRQVGTDGEGELLFYSAPLTLMLAILGLLPRRPWCIGASDADVVAAIGERERLQLIGWGLAPDIVHATGQATLDDLARAAADPATRTKVAEANGLDPQLPLVVCALPHLGEHGMLGWAEHQADVEWLLDALRDCSAQVLVSLHPKADPDHYRAAISARGLRLAGEPLRTILPAADVFVATWSSTVRWAVAHAIPSIVLDHHGTGYRMFDDLAGLVVARDREMFATELGRLVSSPEGRRSHAAALAIDRERLEPLDGGATDRIVELLVAASRARPTGRTRRVGSVRSPRAEGS